MKRMILPILIFAVLLLLTTSQSVWAGAFEPDRDGATIFRAVCASCHGYDGSGKSGNYKSFVDETPSVDLRGLSRWRISRTIRDGVPPVMPGFNEEEISNNEADTLANCISDRTCLGQPDPSYQASVDLRDEPPWFVCTSGCGTSPYVVNLSVGNRVRFINAGQTWHTVTQGDFLVAASSTSGQTNSGLIGRGGRYFRTFSTSGVYNFYCMLHPFMQMQVCAGVTCSAPARTDPIPQPPPSVPGVGELWVAVQFQDLSAAGKPVDTGAAKAPFPDLSPTFDDFSKPGEIQVIDLTQLPTVSITRAPSPASNPFNNPHYIWGRKGATEMSIDNYFDNYKSFLNGSTKAITLARLTWGTTASHTTSLFDGDTLYGPVQGDYGIQELRPGYNIGSWSVGELTRINSEDANGHSGSMPHGIWAGGSNGTLIQTANSRSNNGTVFEVSGDRHHGDSDEQTCTMGAFPLNAGITVGTGPFFNGTTNVTGYRWATTNVGNPTTASTSVSIRFGATQPTYGSPGLCGTSRVDIPLPGEGAVQTPPSPDDRFIAVSNGPYITFLDLMNNFPTGSTCAGSGTFRTAAGLRICDINVNQFGAHGVAWGRRGDAQTGWRVYMAAKFTNFVSVFDVITQPSGTVAISHAGDIPLIKEPTATAKLTFPGVATTGGQGVTTRPLPTPWQ